MKKKFILFLSIFSLLAIGILAGCSNQNKNITESTKEKTFVVTSTGIVDGVIQDQYGQLGDSFNEHGMPTYSLPLKFENAPKETVSYALVLEDKDAFPISQGFSWIHWTAANIQKDELKENESQTATDFVQGVNSWISPQGGSQSTELSSFYGGWLRPINLILTRFMSMH